MKHEASFLLMRDISLEALCIHAVTIGVKAILIYSHMREEISEKFYYSYYSVYCSCLLEAQCRMLCKPVERPSRGK